ncbi:uncharacterized protein AB675_6863 [Cyphellophora attinorum]|uniref:DUF7514 domain-containing protein n=1 Tax=Cyphellophora attinorum TaxID=1664694 RepID=A0A0N0NQ76_9EURO|nr:uncharacterized protein AB675_6863 [Phialophora attinorum]KPI43379.1 hypothetical protein AB675_6863 [Phialophora attinorum]
MAYQDSYPPPPGHPSDPRYLNSQPQHLSNVPDLSRVRSRDSVAQDGYTSDSSRYSRATKPINEAVNSAFTNSTATASAIAPDILAQLTSQITANVIQQLKASNISGPGVSPSIAPDARSSAAGSPPPDRGSVYTPPSPGKTSGLGVDMSGATVPPTVSHASPPLSQASNAEEDPTSRPRGPQRISTSGDMTVVEKIWGTLFNEQGDPTPRLGQFLRGIAMHLIEDYEPKGSLVVTPSKMQRYYEETKLDNELLPWKDIFDDRTSSISRMLRELEISHHLVQAKLSDRPDVPGLTPEGFEKWFIFTIQAHPDQEFERLAKTALSMPINNPDDKKERFPKELSRRLFPGRSDEAIEATLIKHMSKHCNLNIKSRHNSTVQDPRPVEDTRAFATSVPTNGIATENPATDRPQSFSSVHSAAAVVSDGEDTPTPQPIERERKPYVALPGGGKSTVESTNDPMTHRASLSTSAESAPLQRSLSNRDGRPSRLDDPLRPRPPPIAVHQTQATSQAAGSAPLEIPETRRHRQSAYYRDNPPNTAVPRRARSPSRGNHADYPPDYAHYSTSAASAGPFDDRDKRYRDWERPERLAGDRFDAARMSAYDPRDREREHVGGGETRSRGQSMSYANPDEEYYRSLGVRDGAGAAYPPSSYRDGR